MSNFDVAVIGLGAMGSAALYHLAQQGISCIGIDAHHPPHDRGSSFGQTRLIRKSYFEDERYVPLVQESEKLWDELSAELGISIFHRTGLVYIAPPEGGKTFSPILNCAKKHNFKVDSLTAKDLQKDFPLIQHTSNCTGLFEKDAGYLLVEKGIEAHLRLAEHKGAKIVFNDPLVSTSTDNNEIVLKTKNQSIKVKKVICTLGGWTQILFPQFPMKLKLTRAPLFWFEEKGEHKMQHCFAFDLPNRFLYGFPDLGLGLKAADYTPGSEIRHPEEKGTLEYLPSELTPLRTCLEKYLPHVHPTPTSHAICFYDLSPDENFLIDFHPENKNILFGTAGSGHAFKMSPVIGKALAHMAINDQLYEAARFLKFQR